MKRCKNRNERFWSKVFKSPSCWEWIAAKNEKGYGLFYTPELQNKKAHRESFEMHFGKIPSGKCVLHKCDNPACIRPNHLFIGTQADNMRDRFKKGRARVKNQSRKDY